MHFLKTTALLVASLSLASAAPADGPSGSDTTCVKYCAGTDFHGDCAKLEAKLDYSCNVLPDEYKNKLASIYVPKGAACAFHANLQCKDINTSPNGGSSISFPGSGDVSKFGIGWGGKVVALACWPFFTN